MAASGIAIVIICLVGVIGLVTWVVVVRLAARRPHEPNPQRGQMRGVVQGGMHVGGGRSVAPTRDAPVPEGGGEPPRSRKRSPRTRARRLTVAIQTGNRGIPAARWICRGTPQIIGGPASGFQLGQAPGGLAQAMPRGGESGPRVLNAVDPVPDRGDREPRRLEPAVVKF